MRIIILVQLNLFTYKNYYSKQNIRNLFIIHYQVLEVISNWNSSALFNFIFYYYL